MRPFLQSPFLGAGNLLKRPARGDGIQRKFKGGLPIFFGKMR